MPKASFAFGFLTQNSRAAYFYNLEFQTPTEVGIKGIKVAYAEFKHLLYILKYIVYMN